MRVDLVLPDLTVEEDVDPRPAAARRPRATIAVFELAARCRLAAVPIDRRSPMRRLRVGRAHAQGAHPVRTGRTAPGARIDRPPKRELTPEPPPPNRAACARRSSRGSVHLREVAAFIIRERCTVSARGPARAARRRHLRAARRFGATPEGQALPSDGRGPRPAARQTDARNRTPRQRAVPDRVHAVIQRVQDPLVRVSRGRQRIGARNTRSCGRATRTTYCAVASSATSPKPGGPSTSAYSDTSGGPNPRVRVRAARHLCHQVLRDCDASGGGRAGDHDRALQRPLAVGVRREVLGARHHLDEGRARGYSTSSTRPILFGVADQDLVSGSGPQEPAALAGDHLERDVSVAPVLERPPASSPADRRCGTREVDHHHGPVSEAAASSGTARCSA